MTTSTVDTRADGTSEGTAEPSSKFEQLKARHPWLDHLVRAGGRYTEKHGDHYAAAITYFSILALVPLLMIAFAAAGFVLANNQDLLNQLSTGITNAAPPGLGELLNKVIQQAIEQRGAVGILGLLGALYSGLGWMANLREALSEQWDQRDDPPALLKRYGGDLVAMIGLGVALALSFAITAVATGASHGIARALGLEGQAWVQVLLTIAGIVVTLAANWLVFLWVIARLPREPVTLRSAGRAAILASVGFVVLQQVMTVYIASVTNSPAGAAFGPIIGLLVFANFVSRFILFVTAWAATMKENEREEIPEPAPVVVRPAVTVGRSPGVGATAGLLGAGAVLGVVGSILGVNGMRRNRR
ncbi:inner membrane protein YhjD [Actinomycetospora sp. TBRC 11914]|uniref:inner membrane protein YhjD n=1 Tax=Actinomycetospora sp. TBRC 11914 TaxID=2729387 RepID=UPI00145EB6E7|nr:inner membrane protein YhjD [Actinomycetospora sp. TBRC 11914]NMO92584.1 inner membrane protein YhjD [Actinomycetospora sp. TBRC 11914]